MEEAEIKLLKILEELKEKYFVKSIKLEFEAEGTTFKEAEFLKKLADKTSLELTVKIGGCEAVRDIIDTKKLQADNIIAPMIESEFALKKFVKAVNNVYEKNELSEKKLFINIESLCGYKNFEEITYSEEFKETEGIILGRSDMARSLGLNKDKVNSSEIYEIAKKLSLKMKEMNKKFVVGGGVFDESVVFFKNLHGIKKAIEFEKEWLQTKQKFFSFSNEDIKRLLMLKNYTDNVIRLNI